MIASATGTYSIMYVKLPNKLTTSGTGILNIPPQFETALIDLAIMYGYKDLKYYDKSSAKLQAYIRWAQARAGPNLQRESYNDVSE